MITELEEYASQEPAPDDSGNVKETVKYLKACHQLFERGILGKRAFIRSEKSPILTSRGIITSKNGQTTWSEKVGLCVSNVSDI